MNIIFVSNTMAKPKSFSLAQTLLLLALIIITPIAIALAIVFAQPAQPAANNTKTHTLDNPQAHIDALALQLGDIQARVMRLDALSERLSKMAGIKQEELDAVPAPERGGPEVNAYDMSETQLKTAIDALTQEIEQKSDHLSLFEARLLQKTMQAATMPSSMPLHTAYNSSSYGWRSDPFTGRATFHEGLDFTAETGTPIYAAASGIVLSASATSGYGNLVEVDHGSGLITRYAHTSQMLVHPGEKVEKGQLIAKVGSTGRSTGPHLHFEVRLNGDALDPRKYLNDREIYAK